MLLQTRRVLSRLIGVYIVAFLMNGVWENLQAPLYEGYVSFSQHFPICLRAAFWDAGFITVSYIGLMILNRRMDWWSFEDNLKLNYLIVISVGLLSAYVVEINALTAGRWSYTTMMPTVFSAGISPLIQLAVTSMITFEIYRILLIRLKQRSSNNF